jgi:predicted NodU family carbamoyl transferase
LKNKILFPAQDKGKGAGAARKLYLGINLEMDPSVAIIENGRVLAFSEEERHVRIKHAQNIYPIRALKYCLNAAGCKLSDVTAIAINTHAVENPRRIQKATETFCRQSIVSSVDFKKNLGAVESYGLELIREVSSAVSIPVIGCCGAGSIADFAGGETRRSFSGYGR